MDGYWIVRTYEAGDVGEKTKFFVPGARPTRSKRRLRDAARKQAQNEYSAEKALARLLNANFTEGDLLLAWTTPTRDRTAGGTGPLPTACPWRLRSSRWTPCGRRRTTSSSW